MFTSRAENRFKLRTDNSYERFSEVINTKIFNNLEYNLITKHIQNEKAY